MRFKFFKTVLVLSILITALLVWPLHAWAGEAVRTSVIAAGIIAAANAVLASIALEFSIDKSNQVFMYAVFGGMTARMGLILITLTILLLNGFDPRSLVLGLMAFYVLFLAAEIFYVVRELARRRVPSQRRATRRPTPTPRLALTPEPRNLR